MSAASDAAIDQVQAFCRDIADERNIHLEDTNLAVFVTELGREIIELESRQLTDAHFVASIGVLMTAWARVIRDALPESA